MWLKNVALLSFIAMNLVDQPAPEVTIDQGTLSGRISDDGTFFEYLGILYASTSKETRLQAPLPPPSWEGVLRAVDDTTACIQDNFILIRGTEHCLKMNVYVPAVAKKPLPVMVFIHGGAYFMGDGGKVFLGPEFLVRHDIILVTFNYRLGVLGFLCLGIKEAPGNAGLKDQLAALRWIKKNIAAFGGDPDNITVFGTSAGAASISTLLGSGKVDGLFNRAIMQSGTSLGHWSISRKPIWVASYVAKSLGYNTQDPHELYEILSNLSAKQLASLDYQKAVEWHQDTPLIHLPCIEKTFPGVEAIITEFPYNQLKKNPIKIPVIHGSTSEEGIFFIAQETPEVFEFRNGKYLFASDVTFNTHAEALNVSMEIKKYYFGDTRISWDTIMTSNQHYKHLHFEIPLILESEMIAEAGIAPIYNYYFNYSGNRNYMKFVYGYGHMKGGSHGDELLYLFKGRFWPWPINQDDALMIDRMTTMWTNFAKLGDPTPKITKNTPIKWEPSTKDNLRFLYLNKELTMGGIPSPPEVYKMWKNVYTKYRMTKKEDMAEVFRPFLRVFAVELFFFCMYLWHKTTLRKIFGSGLK